MDDDSDPAGPLGELPPLHAVGFGRCKPEDRIKLIGTAHYRMRIAPVENGYMASQGSSLSADELRTAFTAFFGNENLKLRAHAIEDWISRPNLDWICRKFEH